MPPVFVISTCFFLEWSERMHSRHRGEKCQTDGVAMTRNRRFLQTAALGLSVWLPLAVRADDWPQWRGPNRDGVWNETGIIELFPPGGLEISWRTAVGRGWSSPVVAQGRVYVTDVERAGGKATERVLCFDESNGNLLWSHRYAVDYPDWALGPYGGGPRATPIVRDGKIFTLGALGHLFCFDAVNGHVGLEKSLANEYQLEPFTGITASPLIEDKLLILYMCGKPAACVVAFDKDSGKEVWRALDDSFTYSSPIVIAAGGKRQFIVWTQQGVTSLDPRTGRTWWRELFRSPGDMVVSTPVFSNGRLLIGGLMLELDAAKPAASVLWPESELTLKRILSNTSTALVQGDYVYSARTTGELVCLEAGTGKQVWQTNTVTDPRNGSSIHLTANGDGEFLFTDRGDLLRAKLTPQGYREISRARLVEPTSAYGDRKCAWTPPAFANRHVFARNDLELVRASLAAKP
jgi:outer membrane protein assembly factor BamB